MSTYKRQTEYHKRWYKANRYRKLKLNAQWKYEHGEKGKAYLAKWKLRLRNVVKALKNKPCTDCQGWFEPCQMDFDHRDPAIKRFSISQSVHSTKTILEEVRKCDLVCANCHRLRTQKRLEGNYATQN